MRVATFCLALACFGSFGWAMRFFFTRPDGLTTPMRVTAWVGTIAALMQLAVIAVRGVSYPLVCGGWVLFVTALGLFHWAVVVNRRRPLSWAYSQDEPEHVMTAGPYRYVRHPFYLSYLLAFSGGVLATANPWLIATVVAMTIVVTRAARVEEAKFDASNLAADYNAYRQDAGMFLPRLFRPRRTDP